MVDPRRCSVREEDLVAWRGGELAPADAATLARHATSCPRCQRILADLAVTRDALTALRAAPSRREPDMSAPRQHPYWDDDFNQGPISAPLPPTRPVSPRHAPPRRPRGNGINPARILTFLGGMVAATALVLVAIFVFGLGHVSQAAPAKQQPAGHPTSGQPVQLIAIPNVRGLTQSQACAKLQDLKFSCVAATVHSTSVAPGTVDHSDPAAGSVTAAGSTVTIYLATK